MKSCILLLGLGILAGCSSPQAPAPTPSALAGLSIPDTIDFGVVRAGSVKDTNILFKNTGSDTLRITAQAFDSSHFKLLDVTLKQFNIAPGANRSVGIRFSPMDTGAAIGFDTIRSGNAQKILVLRGNAIPISYSLAGLGIPDTIDFGVVRAGIVKDTNVLFKNTGSDTLRITAQSFDFSHFKLIDATLKQFNIAPGANRSVGIRFSPMNTGAAIGFDTIRSGNDRKVLVLRGSAIPFSSYFQSAPTSIEVKLTGVIGNDSVRGNSTVYNFDFGAGFSSTTWMDTLHFSSHYGDGSSPDQQDPWYNTSDCDISLHIDTTRQKIAWLKVSYDYEHGECTSFGSSHEYWDWTRSTDQEGLILASLPLTKTGNTWTSQDSGSVLNSMVASARYLKQTTTTMPSGTTTQSDLLSITGFKSSAVLSIVIR